MGFPVGEDRLDSRETCPLLVTGLTRIVTVATRLARELGSMTSSLRQATLWPTLAVYSDSTIRALGADVSFRSFVLVTDVRMVRTSSRKEVVWFATEGKDQRTDSRSSIEKYRKGLGLMPHDNDQPHRTSEALLRCFWPQDHCI